MTRVCIMDDRMTYLCGSGGGEDEYMRGGDVPRSVQVRLYGGLREALVGREAVGHEAQAGVGLRGDQAGRQDAGHAARVQDRAAAADLAQRGRRPHQVLAGQEPAPTYNTHR